MENRSLVLDLVEWIAKEPRLYEDVMDAWRTSCPRLSIWEEAVDRGFVRRQRDQTGNQVVHVTVDGLQFLNDGNRKVAA